MDNGFITLHRKITEWEWYTDGNTMRLFVHLLLKANHKEKKWRGQTIERGQLITGRKVLAEELKMGEQQVRTSLGHLKSTNEITIKSTNKFSLVTLVNYDFYQTKKDELTNKLTNKQPTTNQQLTTNNNDNNDNNIKNMSEIKFTDDSAEMKLVDLLLKKMIENNPKTKKPNKQKWCDYIEKMIRIDKYTPKEVQELIVFSQKDSFWMKNIRSASKLREKAERLTMEVANNKENKTDDRFARLRQRIGN